MRARSLGFIAALVMFFGLAAVAYAQTSCGVTPADVRACLARGDPSRVPKQNHNTAPIANAGPDQSVFLGETVIVDGSASTDPDGGPVLFYWTLVSRPPGSTATLAPTVVLDPRASFVVDQEGTYTLELVVADYRSKSLPDIVVVSTSNTRPVANPKASCAAAPNVDCSAPIGSTITLDASASTDVDGNALSYKWSLVTRPPGSSAALLAPTSIATTFVTDAPGNFVAQLIVNDGSLDSVPKTVMVTSTNVKPVAAATINPTSLGALPQSVQLDGSGSTDPEGQGLTYAWSILTKPAGSAATLSNATAVAPTFVADVLGTYTAQLIVNDGFLSSTPVTVSASSANQPPVANAGPDQAVSAGATVQLTSAGSNDPEGSPLGYFWSMLNKPSGSTTDFNSANAANPTFVADRKGTFVAQLIVNDGALNSAPDTVQVTAGNNAPVAVADTFSVAQDGSLVVGAATGVLANDTDADGDALTAILVGSAPTGFALAASGGFTYTPPAGFSGATTFQYKANDGTADSNTVTSTINVTAGLPTVSIAATTPNASETGPVSGVFTFTRTGPTTFDLLVNYAVGGTASNFFDYQSISGQVMIPAGQTSATVTITPVADAGIEGNETVILTIQPSPTTYLVGAPSSATVTIADGVPDTVSIAATTPNASETGPVSGVFTFTRTGPTTFDLLVNYAVGGTASNFFDYQSISGQVMIPAGQTSATVTITPVADAGIEGNETVILTIQPSPTTYLVGASSSATVTIADGVPDTVSIAATTPNASETGPVSGVFTFTRTGPTTFDLLVNYAVGGTASNFFDYQSISGQVMIPAGQTSATVTITPVADAGIEGNETVILTIQPSPTTYLVGASSSATVTIADGVPDTVSIAATTPNASETGPVSGVFTFTRTGPTTFDLLVNYAVGGTASNFFDYQSISGQVMIPAGQTSATVTITPVADAGIEGNETVILTIQPSPTTYLVGAPSSATVTIADGVPDTVSIAATTPNASETGPVSGVFTFTRTGPTTFDLLVNYAVGGTASNFFDYQSISGQVMIPAGQTSATVTITPVADAGIEGNETVILTIQPSPTTYLVGASSSATVTIADGVPDTVSIAATTPNASETGPVSGVFTFTRTGPTTFDLLVNYAVGGTASNFFDYQSISGQVMIPAGQTSATVTITPVADAGIEGNETVILTIQPSPTTYLVGASSSATVTIADGVPDTVSIAATTPNASETGPVSGVFTFTRTGPTTFDVTVSYAIAGTAQNFFDYQSISGSVTIPAGQTSATVTIIPVADSVNDPDETVILTIQPSPTIYLVGSPSTDTVTIQ